MRRVVLVFSLLLVLLAPSCGSSPQEVVFIGDSITKFWNLRFFFLGTQSVNAGISGQTTADILTRFQSDAIDPHPSTIILLAGTNDILHKVPADVTIANLKSMVEMSQQAHIRIIVGTVPPIAVDLADRGSGYAGDFNPFIRSLNEQIKELGVPIADYNSALAGPDGYPKPGVLRDGIHPTSLGYELMTGELSKLL